MKITDIRAAGLRGATPKGGWALELGADDVVHTLVTVHTDAGVVGVGSVFSSAVLVQAALDTLTPICLGANPLEPDRVSQLLHENTFWLGRGGALTHAISGIDIALWDILGQVTGLPVGSLLGGRYRDRVRPYGRPRAARSARTRPSHRRRQPAARRRRRPPERPGRDAGGGAG